MDANESQAILTIVMRNLSLPAWNNLMPDAQDQMLEECSYLMRCESIPRLSKQRLCKSLSELLYYVSDKHSQYIQQFLLVLDQPFADNLLSQV